MGVSHFDTDFTDCTIFRFMSFVPNKHSFPSSPQAGTYQIEFRHRNIDGASVADNETKCYLLIATYITSQHFHM